MSSTSRTWIIGICLTVSTTILGCADGEAVPESIAHGTAAVNATSAANHPTPFSAVGEQGLVDGVTLWSTPETPNGLVSNNSWFSVAGAPDGNFYVGGCDHKTNTALFKLTANDDVLSYVGDARAASEAVGNWLPDETAEKFHVRPLWYQDRLYLTTADYSLQDDLYVHSRGFKWYAYDTQSNQFLDLSASEPMGVGAPHISIFSTVLDAKRGVIYGLGSPNSNLYSYNIATGQTTDLGRSPILTNRYYNPGRYIWLDSDGRVYLTVTNVSGQPTAPKYVLYWDPATGWGANSTWTIGEMLRTGQCTADGKRCYILDYKLRLFLFDDASKTFTQIAAGVLDDAHYSPRVKGIRVRTMHLSANEKKIYFVNDSADVTSLYEWDFRASNYPLELARTQTLDDRLVPAVGTGYRGYTGHDAWDLQGRFLITGFGGEEAVSTNLFVVRIDPVRVKVALGVLPGVSEVVIRGAKKGLHLVRKGDLSTELQVLLRIGDAMTYKTVTAPAGATVVPVVLDSNQSMKTVAVIPDGDTYVVGE